MNNGVETRFSWFKRWNIDPMITWRPMPKVQIKVVGEFLHEEHFKHWGDNAQLAPFAANGPTTFRRLPRDFTFSDPWATNDNDKQAVWASAEAQVTPEWSLRLAGYVNYWDHDVYDILPAGMQANNILMNRTGRFIYNYDSDKTVALDSVYNFKVGPSDHKFLFIAQHFESDNDTGTLTANAPPPLDVFNPVYNYTALVNPRLAGLAPLWKLGVDIAEVLHYEDPNTSADVKLSYGRKLARDMTARMRAQWTTRRVLVPSARVGRRRASRPRSRRT